MAAKQSEPTNSLASATAAQAPPQHLDAALAEASASTAAIESLGTPANAARTSTTGVAARGSHDRCGNSGVRRRLDVRVTRGRGDHRDGRYAKQSRRHAGREPRQVDGDGGRSFGGCGLRIPSRAYVNAGGSCADA